jgi:catechol 2,3-dioxygenase-like lactoylglutathione lyase family enzyme
VLSLDHVQVAVPVGREDAAREFYGGLLGLSEIEKPARLARRGGVWFRVGAHELHLGVEEGFAPARKAHPAFRLDDLAALHALAASLTEAGSPVTWADPAEIPGRERFHVADPFGNRLEFLA